MRVEIPLTDPISCNGCPMRTGCLCEFIGVPLQAHQEESAAGGYIMQWMRPQACIDREKALLAKQGESAE